MTLCDLQPYLFLLIFIISCFSSFPLALPAGAALLTAILGGRAWIQTAVFFVTLLFHMLTPYITKRQNRSHPPIGAYVLAVAPNRVRYHAVDFEANAAYPMRPNRLVRVIGICPDGTLCCISRFRKKPKKQRSFP